MNIQNGSKVLIFKKCCTTNNSRLNKANSSKFLNVISSDIERLNGGEMVGGILVTPFVVIYTFIMLWSMFSYYCLFFLLAFIINTSVSKYAATKKSKNLEKK